MLMKYTYQVNGSLENVRVFDMTMWPNTIDGNLDWE